MGTEYWGGLFDWLRGTALDSGTVSPKDVDLLRLTDDVDEAVRIVTEAQEQVAPKRPE